MSSILSTPCTVCGNTYWQEVLNYGDWVHRCTNCWNTKKIIKRSSKGFWMAVASTTLNTYYLTDKGWMTYEEVKEIDVKATWKRKSKNYRYWVNNPPYGSTVKETYTEI